MTMKSMNTMRLLWIVSARFLLVVIDILRDVCLSKFPETVNCAKRNCVDSNEE